MKKTKCSQGDRAYFGKSVPLSSFHFFGLARFSRLQNLHQNESGSISLASVFGLMLLVMVLGLVMNSSRRIDDRIKMQNAADEAARAGGTVMARSMNSLAFSNQLISDVLALTAFFREGRDQHAAALEPEILEHWRRITPHLESSEFPKFAELGAGLRQKVPNDEEMVRTFLAWVGEASNSLLPVFEQILAEELIPQFQRDLIAFSPEMAQLAASESVMLDGSNWPRSSQLTAMLWRTNGDFVGGDSEVDLPTIPAIDPLYSMAPNQSELINRARAERDEMAWTYLREWNNESMRAFDEYGKISQFGSLWRSFTEGQLIQLLQENANRNLPMQIRPVQSDPYIDTDGLIRLDRDHRIWEPVENVADRTILERDFMFVAVVYKSDKSEWIPKIYHNPISFDEIAVTQFNLFVPAPRFRSTHVTHHFQSGIASSDTRHLGGVPRDFVNSAGDSAPNETARADHRNYYSDWNNFKLWNDDDEYDDLHRDIYVGAYLERSGAKDDHRKLHSLMNQDWKSQLVPVTTQALPTILSQKGVALNGLPYNPPDFSGIAAEDLRNLICH